MHTHQVSSLGLHLCSNLWHMALPGQQHQLIQSSDLCPKTPQERAGSSHLEGVLIGGNVAGRHLT